MRPRSSPLLPYAAGKGKARASRRLSLTKLALLLSTGALLVWSGLAFTRVSTSRRQAPAAPRLDVDAQRSAARLLAESHTEAAHLHQHAQLQQQQARYLTPQAPLPPGLLASSDAGNAAAEVPPCTDEGGCDASKPHTAAEATVSSLHGSEPAEKTATGLYSLAAEDITGRTRPLSEWAGRVALVVNVASACGYTAANYAGLQALQQRLGPARLAVLAFPCNQFGGQEPGSAAEIQAFAQGTYGATFPLFAKVDVNGPGAHSVFQFLKRHLPADQRGGGGAGPGQDLTWNFNKILVGRDGWPVKSYGPSFDAEQLEADILRELAKAA